MNQRDIADRFSRDVDHLLYEAGLTDPRPASPDYDELLEMAQTLAVADFSRQSKIRQSLRRRLLNWIEPAPVATAEIPGPWGLLKHLLQGDRTQPWPPGRRWKNKFVLATLAGLVVVGFMALISNAQTRPKVVGLLAQVLAYLPAEGEVEPHLLTLRWQFRGDDGINSPPVAANGLVYAGDNAGYLYALEARTGQERWRFKTGGGITWRLPLSPGPFTQPATRATCML